MAKKIAIKAISKSLIKKLASVRKEIEKEADKFIGKNIVWDWGKYKGRCAKIVKVLTSDYDGEIEVLVKTYKINGDGGFLSTQNTHHNTYWSLDNFKEL